MKFEFVNGLMKINMDATMTLALAGILLLIGYFIKKKVNILNKYCIPAPVVGGFLFMFVTWIGHYTGVFGFQFENLFQSTFMLAFFTTVGLGASFTLLKKGGSVLAYLRSYFNPAKCLGNRNIEINRFGGALCIACKCHFDDRRAWSRSFLRRNFCRNGL